MNGRNVTPGQVIDLVNRIKRSMAQRGFFGTVRMCWVSVLPGAWLREARRRRIDAEFDQLHDVDTGETLRPHPDEVVGENWSFGTHYAAVEPSAFVEALNRIPICHSDFIFMDFGSGKGRTLLLASEFPFKKIVGVEFCPELNRVARRNVLRHPAAARRNGDIEILAPQRLQFQRTAGAFPEQPIRRAVDGHGGKKRRRFFQALPTENRRYLFLALPCRPLGSSQFPQPCSFLSRHF